MLAVTIDEYNIGQQAASIAKGILSGDQIKLEISEDVKNSATEIFG